MPTPAPHTLSADDVYALTAYILNPNDVVASEFVANSEPSQNLATETEICGKRR
jgi:hypothetical protein